MTINETDSQPQAELKVSTGPGALLRQAREAKGWTQTEVARRLNLRVAVIESIDTDNYKAGVALTFLRGYVKAYAKVVGVPEAQALAAFDSMSHEQFNAVKPMQSFSKKTRQQASDKWLKRISWLVFLGLLGSLFYWWWHDGGTRQQDSQQFETSLSSAEKNAADNSSPDTQSSDTGSSDTGLMPPALVLPSLNDTDASEPPLASATLTDVSVSEQATAAESDSSLNGTVAVDGATASVAVTDTAATNAASTENASEPVASPNADNARLLSLNFTNDCWIKITDSKGKVLSEGIKKAQQSLALEGEPPFKLILGVPTAVRLEYLGKAVDLSSFSAGRAARLTVPQS
ncbi:cytoskeleton protein RodZ [Oceanisphaera sp. W20_SRM_FM3]|uniref:cytoskeleton protein RodZ n=1 Tax=Oceanisphaera sp. W20_SRM_FM3 TaxID=3240267 RepID=UPI003F9C823B